MRRVKVGNMSKGSKGSSLPGFKMDVVNKDEGCRGRSKFRWENKLGR